LESIATTPNLSARSPAAATNTKVSPPESGREAAATPSVPAATATPAQLVVKSPGAPVGVNLDAKSTNSAAMVMALAALLTMGAVYFRYLRSESARIRRKMRTIQTDFEDTLSQYRNHTEELLIATRTAAAGYKDLVRKHYLRSISLDDIRKLAPGARMQPLRDLGVTSLLDCHSWGVPNFARLRGIGPDSANRLAAACAFLTRSANQQPIIHPEVSDARGAGNDLFQCVRRQRYSHESLMAARTALQSTHEELNPQVAEVQAATSFFRWLFGSEKKNPLCAAIDAGKVIEARVTAGADIGVVIDEAKSKLASTRDAVRQTISTSDLAADVASFPDIYDQTFEELLGPGVSGSAVSRAMNEPKSSARAAAEPVTVRTMGEAGESFPINRPGGFEIRVDLEAPPRLKSRATSADCWVPAGSEVSVQGFEIKGGLIYVGRNLPAVNRGTVEPALIDPTQPANSAAANCRVRMLNYWSNYSYADPSARASYLQWLANGRDDPDADVGYVFLYFYGLERRALAESPSDDELALIVTEVERLRSVYARNGSFSGYSGEFLNYLAATRVPSAEAGLADEPPPVVRFNIPFNLRLKLGRLATDGEPLPGKWAYAWYYCDPRSRLPTVAERCADQVKALFAIAYGQRHGEGLILTPNETRLKITYRPASASFGGSLVRAMDVPDVSVLTTPYSKIAAVATECFEQLDGYSRYLGRSGNDPVSLDARLLLPIPLWPESLQSALRGLVNGNLEKSDAAPLSLGELLEPFAVTSAPTRAQYLALTRALGVIGIGIEPDLRFTKDVPDLGDTIGLFFFDGTERLGPDFVLCALIVQLGSVVANAASSISGPEAENIRHHIEKSDGLDTNGKRRLLARMETYRKKAPSTIGLRATIEKLSSDTRLEVIDFLLTIVYADDRVDPDEVRVMEKIYTLFGLDKSVLYSRLHGMAAIPESGGQVPRPNTGPIKLDQAKIARLKAASDEVGKKLAAIFVDEPLSVDVPKTDEALETPTSQAPAGLHKLDSAHAELLSVVLARAQWTRAEFEELCSEKGLMPDGAIERINEAAFAQFDEPMIEGQDPLEIGVHLLKTTST
jgi:uncharacterized tellurite resistance protein B-like protein